MRDGVTGLERRNDTLGAGKELEGFEAFAVGRVSVVHSTLFAVIRMLRTHGGIIQSGGNGMRSFDLPFSVHQDIRHAALQHA